MGTSFGSENYAEYQAKREELSARLFEPVTEYQPFEVHVLSHLADADGLGAGYSKSRAFTLAGHYLGNHDLQVTNDRVMDLSLNSGDDNFYKDWVRNDVDLQIITDMPTLPVNEAFTHANSSGTFLYVFDHHPANDVVNNENYLNATKFGIDGGIELSSGMQGAHLALDFHDYTINMMPPKVDSKDIRRRFYTAAAIGVCGSKADQQEHVGANQEAYDGLTNVGILEKINHPFFGHYTKTLEKGLAETSIPFNLRYAALEPEAFAVLADDVHSRKLDTDKVAQLLQEHPGLFLYERGIPKNFGLNQYMLDNMSVDQRDTVLSKVSTLTQMQPNQIGFLYDSLSDDFRGKDERLEFATEFLSQHGFKPTATYADISPSKIVQLKELFSDNIAVFGDPAMQVKHQEMIKSHQYGFADSSFILGKRSVAEMANLMTSTSKMGAGPLFERVMDYEVLPFQFNEGRKNIDLADLNSVHFHYQIATAQYMGVLEAKIRDGDLGDVAQDMFFFDMNPLKNISIETHPEYKADLRTLTGVLGGICTSTRLLPTVYGTLLTGVDISASQMKVSARINPSPGQKYHFGDLFEKAKEVGIVQSGGGHPGAASTVLEKRNLPLLFEYLKEANGESGN